MPLAFVTGPVRSGKSRFAQALATRTGLPVTYLATAANGDDDPEWKARVARHRADRPQTWRTVETAGQTGALTRAIVEARANEALVVNSLGTWLASELFTPETPAAFDEEPQAVRELLAALDACAASLVVVSEETGWGIVPETRSGRLFRDVLGRANAALAERADRAYLVVCGYALDLKSGIRVRSLP